MAKKRLKKKSHSKKVKHHAEKFSGENRVERILVENFVSLQKVLTNLSIKIDNLSNKISDLLDIFENSAKALAEKNFDLSQLKDTQNEEKIIEGLDKLLDQNKVIAKGLTLMHDKMQGEETQEFSAKIPKKLPPKKSFQIPPKFEKTEPEQSFFGGYQRSLTSKEESEEISEQEEESSQKMQEFEEE